MDKLEQQQIIDEVHENYLQYTILGVTNGLDRIAGHLDNCLVEYDGYYEHFTNPSFAYGFRPHTQEEFIDKCKTDDEFSKKWGLKIEERELSREERIDLYAKEYTPGMRNKYEKPFDDFIDAKLKIRNIPTKLIMVTYNNEIIESYE